MDGRKRPLFVECPACRREFKVYGLTPRPELRPKPKDFICPRKACWCQHEHAWKPAWMGAGLIHAFTVTGLEGCVPVESFVHRPLTEGKTG